MKKRIVYAGYNFFSACLASIFANPEYEVVLVLTGAPSESISNVLHLCGAHSVPVHFGKPTQTTCSRILELAPDFLICAAYSYRVPVEHLGSIRCINVHPSLLPEGRGPNPLPRLLAENSRYAGISLHEMTSKFDDGPVLAQVPLSISAEMTIEQLSLLMFDTASRVLQDFLKDPEVAWSARVPQAVGSYWPTAPASDSQILAVACDVKTAKETLRRFGNLGVTVILADGRKLQTFSGDAVKTYKGSLPGALLMDGGSLAYVGLVDGLLLIRPEMSR
jgi:methionyl-tRNA formyltransferase